MLQHFEARGHSTTRTDPKPANNIFLGVNWLTSVFVYVTLSLNCLTCRRSTGTNERVTEILDKQRCIKEQIHNADAKQSALEIRTHFFFFFLMVVANCNASCYWLQVTTL